MNWKKTEDELPPEGISVIWLLKQSSHEVGHPQMDVNEREGDHLFFGGSSLKNYSHWGLPDFPGESDKSQTQSMSDLVKYDEDGNLVTVLKRNC